MLDFSKAFDKVHHGRLLAKLRHCGVNGKLHKWVTSWLHNRELCVVIDGAESEKCEVASGVPQGSVLGPLFFIIYINDIVHGLNSNIRLFADDALFYQTIHSENDHQLLQQDLDALCAWADRWSMEFNTNKCYALHIMTKHQKRKAVCIPYKMGEHLLERVTDTKYLGVSINEHIQWNTHINTLVGQAHSKLAFLERNLRSCPQSLLNTHPLYGTLLTGQTSSAWTTCSVTLLGLSMQSPQKDMQTTCQMSDLTMCRCQHWSKKVAGPPSNPGGVIPAAS